MFWTTRTFILVEASLALIVKPPTAGLMAVISRTMITTTVISSSTVKPPWSPPGPRRETVELKWDMGSGTAGQRFAQRLAIRANDDQLVPAVSSGVNQRSRHIGFLGSD